jgi:hypothetical protein
MPTATSIAMPTSWSWEEALHQIGFRPSDAGFQLDGFRFRFDGQWVTLESTAAHQCVASSEPMDAPGLWKIIGNGCQPRQLFECLTSVIHAEETEFDETEPRLTPRSWLKWALDTAAGKAPVAWTAPAPNQLEEWISPAALSLQRSAFVRQGAWVVRPDRLALEFPILFTVPNDLDAPRATWLEALLREANQRWRLVRFGVVQSSGRRSLAARIDFTGAPRSQRLFSTSLTALKYGAAWVAESAELLADTRQPLEALAAPPPNTEPRKEQLHDPAIGNNH